MNFGKRKNIPDEVIIHDVDDKSSEIIGNIKI